MRNSRRARPVAATLVALLSVPAVVIAWAFVAPAPLLNWSSWSEPDPSDPSNVNIVFFGDPIAVDADALGDVYVIDTSEPYPGGSPRIVRFTGDGVFVTKWGSWSNLSTPGGFYDPTGIAADIGLDPSRNFVYVSDKRHKDIQKFSFVAPPATCPAGTTPVGPGVCHELTFGTGWLHSPHGLAVDPRNGDVLVADFNIAGFGGGNQVVRFDRNGAWISQFGAGSTQGGNGTFYGGPTDVAVAPNGDIYVAEDSSFPDFPRIQKFDEFGAWITQWGSAALFNAPQSVALDPAGNVYVADVLPRIQVFDGVGTLLGEWGELGSGPAQFDNPWGVAVDAAGQIFVSDRFNTRISKFAAFTSGGGPEFFDFDLALRRLKIFQRGRHKDYFWVNGSITLDPDSDGLNLPEEASSLTIGPTTFEIPAGKFQSRWGGRLLLFRGMVGDAWMQVYLLKSRGEGRYYLTVFGKKGAFPGITNPVTVGLVLGNDSGEVTKNAWIR